MADKTQLVRFVEAGTGENDISIALDDVANNGATGFIIGTSAFLRVSRNPKTEPYTMFKSGGSLSCVGTNIPYSVTDEIVIFANTKEATLDHYPSGFSYTWLGNNPGVSVSITGKVITLSTEAVAVMKCSYTTYDDRWELIFDEEGQVVVVAVMDDASSYTTVTFGTALTSEGEIPEPQYYELTVKDYCSEEVVPAATVWLDDVEIGATDPNGIVPLGELVPGSEHTLKISKSGYQDSDLDNLKNDTFTVPIE
jgi:hypothetical protein